MLNLRQIETHTLDVSSDSRNVSPFTRIYLVHDGSAGSGRIEDHTGCHLRLIETLGGIKREKIAHTPIDVARRKPLPRYDLSKPCAKVGQGKHRCAFEDDAVD